MLDANVLISAAIQPRGPSGRIVAALLGDDAFTLVLPTVVLEEAAEALRLPRIRRYLRLPRDAQRWLADIAAIADPVEDVAAAPAVARDPDDDRVLAGALAGRVEVIVTGDEDLLVLGQHEGIAIVSPRSFLALLAR